MGYQNVRYVNYILSSQSAQATFHALKVSWDQREYADQTRVSQTLRIIILHVPDNYIASSPNTFVIAFTDPTPVASIEDMVLPETV